MSKTIIFTQHWSSDCNQKKFSHLWQNAIPKFFLRIFVANQYQIHRPLFPAKSCDESIIINIGICMWNPSVISWLGEMGYGSTYLIWCYVWYCGYWWLHWLQKHSLHGHDMSYNITFLAFKNDLATNNHIVLLIVHLIINIFLFYFQTRICYAFYVLDRHHNWLVLTHCKLMTIKPQFFTDFDWNW